MRVLRGIGAPLVACLAAASVLAVVIPGQAGAADPPPPKKFVTGWLPYWDTSEATRSVVDNASVFQDASPFVFDANSKTDIALTADFRRVASHASVVEPCRGVEHPHGGHRHDCGSVCPDPQEP